MLVNYSWARGLHWVVVDKLSEWQSIGENGFSVSLTIVSLLEYDLASSSHFHFCDLFFRFCMCCYSLCEFICASVLLYLEDTISLELFTTSGLYNIYASYITYIPYLALRGGVWWRHPIWDWVFHNFLLSEYSLIVGRCISSHLQ